MTMDPWALTKRVAFYALVVFIVVVAGGPRLGDVRAGGTAAAVGVQASWVGGGLACAAVVLLALAVPAFRQYNTSAVTNPDKPA